MEAELQFDQVQHAAASACRACQQVLRNTYYQTGGQLICENCAASVQNAFGASDGGFLRFSKALGYGVAGAAAGSAVYTAVLALAHINAALITILIGWLVGKGVNKGSGGRGGIGYQIMAVLITYMSIGFSAVLAEVLTGEAGEVSSLRGILICIIGMVVGGVLVAMKSILGAVITFFGLQRAWILNKRVQLDLTGPHSLTSRQESAPFVGDQKALPQGA
jgi:hypothetical protein